MKNDYLDVVGLEKIEQSDEICEPRYTPGLSDQSCPTEIFLSSFDVKAAEGTWYVIEAYPSPFYLGLGCLSVKYEPTGC